MNPKKISIRPSLEINRCFFLLISTLSLRSLTVIPFSSIGVLSFKPIPVPMFKLGCGGPHKNIKNHSNNTKN